MAQILVIAEQRNGKLSEATLELCKAAKAIASGIGATPAAAVFYKDDSLAKEVAKYIPEVFSVVDAKLASYDAELFTQAVKAVVESQDVKGVLIAHSYDGVDYAAQGGAGPWRRYSYPTATRSVVEGGTVVFTRNTYNGKIQEQRSVKTDKFVATFEKGAFDKEAAGAAGKVTAVSVSHRRIRRKIKEIVDTMAGAVDITQAKIIVSGGRGTKEKDKYNDVIVNLAKKLGGEFAASRPGGRRGMDRRGAAGGAVRQDRHPGALCRGGHLGRHPARGGHEGFAVHRGHQQGPRSADIQHSHIRHRGRPLRGHTRHDVRARLTEEQGSMRQEATRRARGFLFSG